MLLSWVLYTLAVAARTEGSHLQSRKLRLRQEYGLDDGREASADNNIDNDITSGAGEEWEEADADSTDEKPYSQQQQKQQHFAVKRFPRARIRVVTVFSTTTDITVVTTLAENPITTTVVVTVEGVTTVVDPAQGGGAALTTETVVLTSSIGGPPPQRRAPGPSAPLSGAETLPTASASAPLEKALLAQKRRDSEHATVTSVLTILSESVVTEIPTVTVTSTTQILSTTTVPASLSSTTTVFATIFVGSNGLPTLPPQAEPTTVAITVGDLSILSPSNVPIAEVEPAPAPAITAVAATSDAAPASQDTSTVLQAPTFATQLSIAAFSGALAIVLVFIYCLRGKGNNGGFGIEDDEKPLTSDASSDGGSDGDEKKKARASARFSTSSGTLIDGEAAERGEVPAPPQPPKKAMRSSRRPSMGSRTMSYRETVRIMFKLEDIERWEDLEKWEESPTPAPEKSTGRFSSRKSRRPARPDMFRHPSALPQPLALTLGRDESADYPPEKVDRRDDGYFDDDDEKTMIGSDITTTSALKAKQTLPAIPPPARAARRG